ncbi:MAG: hypothetical protein KGL48_09985 [Sphingomonadales bacterium]|nr:hypothetical protein [Sphingomonadales bacterium]
MSDNSPKGRLADLPLSERRALEIAKQREIADGLTRAHVQNALERDVFAAANFARAIKFGREKG